jgi:hypothetical protein
MGARKRWYCSFQMLEDKTTNQNSIFSKISFKNAGEVKTFSAEVRLRVLVTSRATTEECLKEALQTEMEW